MFGAIFGTAILPAAAEDLVSGLSQDTIQITSNYTGTAIVVFGDIERPQNLTGSDVVVVVRGPDTDITVRKRDRIAGIWVNRDAATLSGVPSYYFLASTRPVSRSPPPRRLIRYDLGLQNLEPDSVFSHHPVEPFRQALLRHLENDALYTDDPAGVEFLSNTLFRARVPVPARGDARPVLCRCLSVPRRRCGERPIDAAVHRPDRTGTPPVQFRA